MVRIAVTGHMDISPSSVPAVEAAVHRELKQSAQLAELTGLSCLARGADSIFAEAILALGGQLEVVLPCSNYREAKVKSDHAEQFDHLMSRATQVQVMPFDEANRTAYEAANDALLKQCDSLVAVWDGLPASKGGGTASVVEQARERDIPVHVLWPAGTQRG